MDKVYVEKKCDFWSSNPQNLYKSLGLSEVRLFSQRLGRRDGEAGDPGGKLPGRVKLANSGFSERSHLSNKVVQD